MDGLNRAGHCAVRSLLLGDLRTPLASPMQLTLGPEFQHAREDLWVFGYGSLIWRPGFEFVEPVASRMTGLHRSLCVRSWHHCGLADHPGLVRGLERGGACRGVALRVVAEKRAATIAYLREREQVTRIYRENLRNVLLLEPQGRRVTALCYV